MANTDQSPADDEAKEFMLAEYTLLRDLRAGLDFIGESRVNFYLGVISATLVGLALLDQTSVASDIVAFIDLAVYIGLLLLGLITYARVVERSLNIVAYSRGMNRIRRYFLDRHPDLEPYLSQPTADDQPSFRYRLYNPQKRRLGVTGLAPLVMVINSIVAAVGIVILLRATLGLAIGFAAGLGVVVFSLMVWAHERYASRRYRARAQSATVNFPATVP